MEVEFEDDALDRLETDPAFTAGFSQAVVKAYRKRIQFMRAAPDERAVRAWKSLHLEKLKGTEDDYSIRLNDQWRLRLRFVTRENQRTTIVIRIEDYH